MRPTCSVVGCSGLNKALGLCAKHYQIHRRRESGVPEWSPRGTCSVEWCDRPCHAHGLCSNHYQIRNRNGSETSYKRARNGMGTGGTGWPRLISTARGQEYEHVVMCRRAYGELPEHCVIHHLNGDNHDNRLDNLLVCVDQGQHMRCHWYQCFQWSSEVLAERKLAYPIVRVYAHLDVVYEHAGMLYTGDMEPFNVPQLPNSYGLLQV